MIDLLFAAALAAQDVAPPAPAPAPVAAGVGVTPYPLSFFVAGNPSNAFDMIARVPGFTFEAGETVRGFASAAGNVLIDGKRPTSKASTLEEALKRIPAESVVRIELIRGGAPGIDMQGRSVLANVVRSTAAVTDSSVVLQQKAFPDGHIMPRGEFQITQRKGGLVWSAGLQAFSEIDVGMGNGTQTRRDRTGAIYESGRLDIDSRSKGYQGTFEAELTRANDVIRVNAALKRNLQGYDETLGVLNNLGRLISTDKSVFDYRVDKAELGGDYTRALPANLTLRVLGLQTLSDERRDGFSGIRGSNTVVTETGKAGESILRATLTQARSPSLTLEGGGEAAFNFLDAGSARVANGVTQVLPNANVRVEEKRAEGFAKASIRSGAKLSMELEARAEVSKITQTGDTNSGKSFFFAKPRALLIYKATPSTEVRLRLEREVGQLNFGNFAASSDLNLGTVNAGNAQLEPERNWAAEVALERRFWGEGAVVLTLTHHWVQQIVDRRPIGGLFDGPGNIGDGTRDQAKLTLALPLDRLGISGGRIAGEGFLLRSKVTDPVTGRSRRISSEEPYGGSFVFTQDLPKIGSTWALELDLGAIETSYRIDEVRREKTEPYLSAYWEWRPRPDLSIKAQIDNFTGRSFERRRTLYDGPRGRGVIEAFERRDAQLDPFFFVRVRKQL